MLELTTINKATLDMIEHFDIRLIMKDCVGEPTEETDQAEDLVFHGLPKSSCEAYCRWIVESSNNEGSEQANWYPDPVAEGIEESERELGSTYEINCYHVQWDQGGP
jgi:hypothetical protein